MTFGYIDRFKHWFSFSLDSRKDTLHSYMIASQAGDSTTFTEARSLAIKDEFTPFSGAELLGTDDGTVRRTWEVASDDELVIREERRALADEPWATELVYRLHRK